jgi:hypothetical protein
LLLIAVCLSLVAVCWWLGANDSMALSPTAAQEAKGNEQTAMLKTSKTRQANSNKQPLATLTPENAPTR